MSALQIVLLCLCGALAILFIVARVLKGGMLGLILKTVASFGFVSSGVVGIIVSDLTGSYKWALGLIVIGLLLGMIGDIILDLKVIYPNNDKYYLNTGMISFFLGHICYISAFSIIANPITRFTTDLSIIDTLLIGAGASVVLSVGTMLSSKKMGLKFGNFTIQTAGYTFILNFSMIYALILSILGVGLWLAFIGLALFLLSDIVLSFQYFGGKIASKPLIAINHALYYAAQIILVAVLFTL